MPTSYTKADADVVELLRGAMARWHPALLKAGVSVGVLMALNPDGPAIKSGGYEALATIKVVSAKDRVSKGYDAELLIDEREWAGMREEHRLALLDHELSHLGLVPLAPAELARVRAHDANAPAHKLDDLGRPKLRTVPGDWNAGDGFAAVVGRHRDYAVEFLNLSRCYARAKAASSGDNPAGHLKAI